MNLRIPDFSFESRHFPEIVAGPGSQLPLNNLPCFFFDSQENLLFQ